jgi:hypothetical protein
MGKRFTHGPGACVGYEVGRYQVTGAGRWLGEWRARFRPEGGWLEWLVGWWRCFSGGERHGALDWTRRLMLVRVPPRSLPASAKTGGRLAIWSRAGTGSRGAPCRNRNTTAARKLTPSPTPSTVHKKYLLHYVRNMKMSADVLIC